MPVYADYCNISLAVELVACSSAQQLSEQLVFYIFY